MQHKAVPPQYREYEMTVYNGRPLYDTHRIVFVDHATEIKDVINEAGRTRVYELERRALIKKRFGASDVVVFDYTDRSSYEEGRKLWARDRRSRVCTTTMPRRWHHDAFAKASKSALAHSAIALSNLDQTKASASGESSLEAALSANISVDHD